MNCSCQEGVGQGVLMLPSERLQRLERGEHCTGNTQPLFIAPDQSSLIVAFEC
jgi:hypothetical protein